MAGLAARPSARRMPGAAQALGVRMCISERLEEDVGEEPPVQLGISPFSRLTRAV